MADVIQNVQVHAPPGSSGGATTLAITPALLKVMQVQPSLRETVRVALLSPEELAAWRQRMWTLDDAWASKATIVDGRQPLICGGGGCNAPYCSFQFWNVDTACSQQTFTTIMFQLERFMLAKGELSSLKNLASTLRSPAVLDRDYANANDRLAGIQQARGLDMQAIQRNPGAWATWVVRVYRAIGVMRWASNLRKMFFDAGLRAMVGNGTSTPGSRMFENISKVLNPETSFSGGHDANYGSATGGAPSDLVMQQHDLRARDSGIMGLHALTPSINTWAFDQLGWDDRYARAAQSLGWETDIRALQERFFTPYFYSGGAVSSSSGGSGYDGRRGDGADQLPPITALRVPTTEADFDPTWWFYPNGGDRLTMLRGLGGTVAERGTRNSAGSTPDVAFRWDDAFMGPYPSGSSVEAMLTDLFSRTAPASGDGRGSWAPQRMSWAIVMHAYAQLVDHQRLLYAELMEKALDEWHVLYARLPEQMRTGGFSLDEMRTHLRALKQAELDAAAGAVGAAGAVITTVASLINPIAGVVSGIVFAIATLLIRFALEIGLVRTKNPSCPPPPFIRMVVAPSAGGPETDFACDFTAAATHGGYANLQIKVDVIRAGAQRRLAPSEWYGALRRLEAAQPAPTDPPGTTNNKKFFAGIAGVLLGIAAVKFI